jgi:hypothetical protein
VIVELVGYVFCAAARLRRGDARTDLDHLGQELRRLGGPVRQPAASSS